MAVKEREPAPSTTFDLIKRVLVGRPLASSHLEHTLLPKILALPVFSSDALSSVAYATEEILRVLVVASAAAYSLVMPISIGIATLMVIVVISYRQTVRAYPNGGGAYIVSKENLGTPAGLVAAAALLTDYVLTVAVSVVAGVFAITSAMPGLLPYKVELSIGFIALITLANLRGVRESGTLFAVPTYGFIVSIFVLVVTGLVRCATGGCPAAGVPTDHVALGAAATVGLGVILHAFSSGSTALTGVEAISNGVPAFRRPQARNAAATLAVMGTIAVTMFVGISFLTARARPIPSDSKSVVAQLADGVFHGGFLYYAVQVFTAAILVLAANTSYQDFPRLSSILARDRFLPRQFENRGDRLVFSNGVILLAIMASLLVLAFDADLSRLIQLYVVGVFTSFTLSQTGMVRHWLKVAREGGAGARGWQRSLVINAIGAVATFVVLVDVVATKFVHGAWIVIAAMPVFIAAFYGVHRHYQAFRRRLRGAAPQVTLPGVANHVVLVVEDLNAATAEAVGYIRSFSREFRAVHVARGAHAAGQLADAWREFLRGEVELEVLAASNDPAGTVVDYVRSVPRQPGDFVTVVIPELFTRTSLLATLFRPSFRLKLRLLREEGVVITDVPVVVPPGRPPASPAPRIPAHIETLVFVAAANDAIGRTLAYARTLQTEIRAVYFALDPEEIEEIQQGWAGRGFPVALDIVEAPFRDLGPPITAEVRRYTGRPDSVVSVILPEIIPDRGWHRILHNQRALFIKRLLLFEPNVILSSVPYQIR